MFVKQDEIQHINQDATTVKKVVLVGNPNVGKSCFFN